jgi:hypothetical protein
VSKKCAAKTIGSKCFTDIFEWNIQALFSLYHPDETELLPITAYKTVPLLT